MEDCDFSSQVLTKGFLEEHIDRFIELISDWPLIAWSEKNFLYELPKKWQLSHYLEKDGKIIAFCIASNKIVTDYYIHLFFVSKHFRGLKVGGQLLKESEKRAQEHGLDKIHLRCPCKNIQALRFYKKHGFSIIKKVKDEVSGDEPDYILIKSI